MDKTKRIIFMNWTQGKKTCIKVLIIINSKWYWSGYSGRYWEVSNSSNEKETRNAPIIAPNIAGISIEGRKYISLSLYLELIN